MADKKHTRRYSVTPSALVATWQRTEDGNSIPIGTRKGTAVLSTAGQPAEVRTRAEADFKRDLITSEVLALMTYLTK